MGVEARQPIVIGTDPDGARRRNQWIDVLRGLAIISVMIWHGYTPSLMSWYPWSANILRLGWAGVDLFFVVSGFLIGGILIANRTSPNYFKAFYGRRFFRIAPLYCLAVVFAAWSGSKEPLWALLTFTQNILWASEGRFGDAWVGVTWSLAVEEQFYVIAPLLILLVPPRALPWVLVPLVVTAPALRFALASLNGWPFPSLYHGAYLMLPTRMDGLFLGVLAACALHAQASRQWLSDHRSSVRTAAVVLVAGCAAMSLGGLGVAHRPMLILGYTWIALTATALVLLAATTARAMPRIFRPLELAGLACFSLYLFHIPVGVTLLYSAPSFWKDLPLHPLPFWLSRTVVLVLLAYLAWRFVEAPCIAFAHRIFPYRPSSVPVEVKLPAVVRHRHTHRPEPPVPTARVPAHAAGAHRDD